ncbi:hypothetical protein SAMN02745181_3040 [Rubritalea squalenifaciens DSM 18772]|uniref:Uncharacterized protein n=1 Tax=Rubritalea squalenifaciens DSM 18772 TaxID=1123071 RepID=A0A1M6P0Y3_9BACT|nr:hypothetical protein [Rubritalea squalenifaciens]SHK01560.1 hypothetical protein SAMN02745181_3040 [Rubritalea squalenifaciens DSM 18772]
MKLSVSCIGILASLCLTCCDSDRPSIGSQTEEEYGVRSGFQGDEGDALDDGRVVFHVFETVKDDPTVRVPVFLEEDYGMIVFNVGSYEEPALQVKFMEKSSREIIAANGMEEVLLYIGKMKRGCSIGHYDTCSVPTFYGLDYGMIERIDSALERQGLKLPSGERHVTCICPETGG